MAVSCELEAEGGRGDRVALACGGAEGFAAGTTKVIDRATRQAQDGLVNRAGEPIGV